MQYSSQILFCNDCGLANELTASHCAGCQHPLDIARNALNMQPVAPAVIAPPPALEVTPGSCTIPVRRKRQTGTAGPPVCNFQPGSILAERYRIQEEIGRGGFSIVYRAVDLEAERKHRMVAIKRIPLSQLTTRQSIDATETFNRETFLHPLCQHVKGIPTYYGHLSDAENWYLIMEYIKGQTLEDHLQKAPGKYLKENEVLKLGIALAEIIYQLHTLKLVVIFRDLKPANVLLTPQGQVFLIDFGIARMFTPGKTKDTTPLGSPGYAPPEQYGNAQTDPRSDIYSLGATLQTLFTGRDLLELRAGETSLNPKTPSPALAKLLDEMLSAEKDQRPATILQVKKRLEALHHRPPVIYMLGLIFIISFLFFDYLLNLFLPLSPLKFILNYIPLFMAKYLEETIQQKCNLPQKIAKGFRRYWWLGVVTGAIFVTLWLLVGMLLHLPADIIK